MADNESQDTKCPCISTAKGSPSPPPNPLRQPPPPFASRHSWCSLSSAVSPFPPLVAMYNWRRQFALVDEAIPYLGIVTAKQTRTRIAGNVCRLISAAIRAYIYTCTVQQFPRIWATVIYRSRISVIIRTGKQRIPVETTIRMLRISVMKIMRRGQYIYKRTLKDKN